MRRRDKRGLGLAVEGLERRDCPAGISIGDVSIDEGTSASGMARLTVTLSERASSTVTVDWSTVDGTATVADKDYRAASGTLVFTPGQKSKTIAVTVWADANAESDETFGVQLSNPVNATLQRDTGTVTIRTDDVAAFVPPTVSVAAPASLPERNVGRSEATFVVSLSAAVDVPVSVEYATADGSAKADDGDYVRTSGRVTFAPGETTKNVTVGVLGDARIEQDETFQLVLSGPVRATLGTTTATATILNDDVRPVAPPMVTVVAAAPGSAVEGNSGESAVTFEVRLSSAAAAPVTVTYATADGTARVSDNDYRSQKGTIIFAPGETAKQVSVTVIGDTKPESDETFSLGIVSATGASVDRGSKAVAFTILDDDTPPAISVNNVTLTEGDSGSAPITFTITLNKAWSQEITVAYATRDGSATVADSDYVAVTGTLTFAAGETSKTVSVNITGDTKAEANETFSLILSSPTHATLARGAGTAQIINDDSGEVPGFQITVDYLGTVRQSIRDACDWAAQRWSQVIVGDLPGVQDPDSSAFIDDLRITVQEGLLGGATNGPDGTLANAGPVEFRSGSTGLPWDAVAGIDPFDASDPQLRNIVLHEFGHALGFGISGGGVTFYSQFVVGSGFTGPNAVREYRSLFGNSATSVPLETGGGGGTAGAHWSDSVFKTELMTGYSEAPGVPMPLSRLTVAAMQDMGYTVNYAAADAFSRPSQTAGNAAASSASGSSTTNPLQRPARGGSPLTSPLPLPTAAAKSAAAPAESRASGFFASLGSVARSTQGSRAAAGMTRLDQRTFARLA